MDNKKWFSSLGLRYLGASLIMMAAQYLVMFVAGAVLSEEVFANNYLLVAMLPSYAIALPFMILLITKNMPGQKMKESEEGIGLVVKALFASMGVMYVGNLIGTLINSLIASGVGGSGANVMSDIITSTSIGQTALVAVIAAPIIEEILFRKLLIDRTVKYGQGIAIVVSAVVFGLYHGNIIQFTYATMLGLILGYVYTKTGKLHYTIILHVLINFWGSVVSVLVMDLSGYSELLALVQSGADSAEQMKWTMAHPTSMMIFGIYGVVQFACVIAGIIILCMNLKKCINSLEAGEVTLESGTRFKTIVLNLGAILFMIFWIGMAVFTVINA